ncbi:Pentatricopeptide repeat-containing protein [Hibiscus syriacus]|uniref:Pentatricopeptide repeat-containing protein n=1 Tax=Hibiscus syriacus TaxID=106335 RepID=A0A6A2YNP2_HIBSY|nr:pentatricopeptide repeat-containing protein At4g35850, mitochondrial [Hibiscus syriacus]KAE8680892.1 Pentatricopeptide repeat-containing protein [Hibiscus syriacus]
MLSPMKFFFRSISGPNRTLLRALGRRQFSDLTAEKAKRNYADNVSEYNTVLTSLNTRRRHYLLRDVYDDMVLDGVQPTRDTFEALIMGTMRGSRMQDALFFRDEMKAMGLVPEASLYNFLISTCGKCKNSSLAVQILEEMKRYDVKPNGQTYVCLINACAAAGRLDQVLAIVRDMTAAGGELNKFCYAGLIIAHTNMIPRSHDVAAKIIELAEQSKGWSSVEESGNTGNTMLGISEEELYNLPTADFVHRRFFIFRPLTVSHVVLQIPATETLLEMLKNDGKNPDIFITMQILRCYLNAGNIDRAVQIFEDYLNEGKPPAMELYATFIEGAMVGHTPRGMELAQEALVNMTKGNFFLNAKFGSDLLLAAAGEKTGGYTNANYIWDLMQARNVVPSLAAVEAYYNGLKEREIPEDDPRLQIVTRTLNNLRSRFGIGPGRR